MLKKKNKQKKVSCRDKNLRCYIDFGVYRFTARWSIEVNTNQCYFA